MNDVKNDSGSMSIGRVVESIVPLVFRGFSLSIDDGFA